MLLWSDSSPVGAALLEELLERTDAEVVLTGLDEPRLAEWHAALPPERARRVTPLRLDPRDGRGVQTAIDRVQLAVCAVGPFRPAPPAIAEAALSYGVDYVDLSGQIEEHTSELQSPT